LDAEQVEALRKAGALNWLAREQAAVDGTPTPPATAPRPGKPDEQAAVDEPGKPAPGVSKDELRRRAKELNIKLRGGESYQRLEKLIAEAGAPPPAA
jgi:hypothetical protein